MFALTCFTGPAGRATAIARELASLTTHFVPRLALAALTVGLACGGSSTPAATTDVNKYLKELPSWATYSPTLPDEEPHAIADAGVPQTETPDGGPTYVCQTTPYKVQRTPADLVTYSPNVEMLWPGSLLQGRSYRDGKGMNELLALTVAERTPINVSIPALKTQDNFRQVVPNQATVSQAIGGMIGAATKDDLKTPSTMTFEVTSYNSEQQFALSVGISGRYLGFKAKANFDYDQAANETTVVVHFVEKMFEVVVAPPQTPGAFFSSDFTKARLDEQVALGRIGPDNLPIYVSNVVYGRMFTFAMTSKESEKKIRAALKAAYDWGTGNVKAQIASEYAETIKNSKISITSVGGTSQATLSVIQDPQGDWHKYFDAPAPLSSATPLSYTFRSLADGTVALVTESTTYQHTDCSAVLTAGPLARQPVQLSLAVPPTPTLGRGDLNGDGRMDLVWNGLGTANNEVQVGFGRADGTFEVFPRQTIGASPTGGWTGFALVVADMDGDGKDDLVWNRIAQDGKSETWVATSKGDGTFNAPQAYPRSDLDPRLTVRAARIQAKTAHPAQRDLLWTAIVRSDLNLVTSTIFSGATPVDLPYQYLTPPPIGWMAFNAGWGPLVGDLNGDGVDDLTFAAPANWAPGGWGAGKVYTAVNDGSGKFTVRDGFPASFPCTVGDGQRRCNEWFAIGYVDDDNKADILRYEAWIWPGKTVTSVLLSNGDGTFTNTATQDWGLCLGDQSSPGVNLVDLNGNGKADLVWVELNNDPPSCPAQNEAVVRIANAQTDSTGRFIGFATQLENIKPADAQPPGEPNWKNFRVFFADVNGDGKNDVVLTNASKNPSVYVIIR